MYTDHSGPDQMLLTVARERSGDWASASAGTSLDTRADGVVADTVPECLVAAPTVSFIDVKRHGINNFKR